MESKLTEQKQVTLDDIYQGNWQQLTLSLDGVDLSGCSNCTAPYIKAYIVNYGGTPLYFDDISVEINPAKAQVLTTADYYPFGSIMRERQLAGIDKYRFGYQGDFSEDETEETGWNSFELRMYDGVIGRWLSVDPKNQYFSPYLSMGNNPTIRVDPDGGNDVYFNEDGSYSHTVEYGWFHNFFIGHRGFYDDGNGSYKQFQFNDQSDALKFGEQGELIGINLQFDPGKLIAERDFTKYEDPNLTVREAYLLGKEDGVAGGQFDFVSGGGELSIVSGGELHLIEGRAYNQHDAGNFLTGAALQIAGFPHHIVRAGANWNAFWYGKADNWEGGGITWTGDSSEDLQAVKNGFKWSIRKYGLRSRVHY